MGRDEMRAGDSDREAVAATLKSALDEGRLDLHEYDERLQKTYIAKTYGDLNGLLDDLPRTVPAQQSQVQGYQPPVASPAAAPAGEQRSGGNQLARWVGPYAGVMAVTSAIWAVTCIASGHLQYYWPVWMLIPLIFGVFGQWSRHHNGGSADRLRDARRAARRERRGR